MAADNVVQKVYTKMTGKRLKPGPIGGVRIISTVFKPVENAETAFREANAARLARARYDQATRSDDPVVVAAMLEGIVDDGSAGAALLLLALHARQAQKRDERLRLEREARTGERDAKHSEYRKIADQLGLKHRGLRHEARAVHAELEKRGQKVLPSIKTLERALR
jgi:hypothetical protein